jgi:hypothetical protein
MRAIFMIPSRDPPTLKRTGDWSAEFNDFIACCLRKDFTQRPTAKALLKHPYVAAAVARLEANGGASPLLAELVDKCMPIIDEARREDAEADAAEAEAAIAAALPSAAAAGGDGAGGGGGGARGAGSSAAGTMRTMRRAGAAAAGGTLGSGTMVKDGKVVHKKSKGTLMAVASTMRRAGAGGGDATGTVRFDSSTMRVADDSDGKEEGGRVASGTFVYQRGGDAGGDAGDADDGGGSVEGEGDGGEEEVPAFMAFYKNQQQERAAEGARRAGGGSVAVAASGTMRIAPSADKSDVSARAAAMAAAARQHGAAATPARAEPKPQPAAAPSPPPPRGIYDSVCTAAHVCGFGAGVARCWPCVHLATPHRA